MTVGNNLKLAVVIPCFYVKERVGKVLEHMGPEVDIIICVDDDCPQKSGEFISKQYRDPRLKILFNPQRLGVGGASMNGFQQALEMGADIIVKCDGDGQMNPALIKQLVEPIANGKADYVKGNRFHEIRYLTQMPWWRLVGNASLSFLSKLSTGYWKIFDSTNGYVAIHAVAAKMLPFQRISRGYFFESDMLFRLNVLRAVVNDIPMPAIYSDEKSHLSELRAIIEFPAKHLRNFAKRIFYNYLLRDFNMASLNLAMGTPLFLFGLIFGLWKWVRYAQMGQMASSGTVMLAALPLIIGVQLILSFFNYDMQNIPTEPLQKRMP